MPHPCRTRLDTGGNPKYKMHLCDAEDSPETTCGLKEVFEVGIVGGFTSVCRTCFPRVREEASTEEGPPEHAWKMVAREEPWTKEGGGNPGDAIEGRTEEEAG